jgi:hypothetical protein
MCFLSFWTGLLLLVYAIMEGLFDALEMAYESAEGDAKEAEEKRI